MLTVLVLVLVLVWVSVLALALTSRQVRETTAIQRNDCENACLS